MANTSCSGRDPTRATGDSAVRTRVQIKARRVVWLPALLLAVCIPNAADAQAATPTGRTSGTDRSGWSGSPDEAYAPFIIEAARRFSIPVKWIRAVMRIESRGNARAVSPAGAMGLMQIMPTTWADLSARYGLGTDPFDPRANIHAGAAYLRLMWDRYGNLAAMLAAYNAGPGRADAYTAGRRPLPSVTVAYVDRVTRRLRGGQPMIAMRSAIDPLAWRRAAIFAARSGSTSTGSHSAITPASKPQPARPDEAMNRADDRPAGALFVALFGETRP